MKIDATSSMVAYHVNDGATNFNYAVDAHSAVARHPLEWSLSPWSREDADAARKQMADRHAEQVEDAKARGTPMPAPLPPEPAPLTAEEQAALDEHAKAVAEANERLKAFREKQAEEKALAEQVAADEALVASPPPQPDPNRPKRPFGRPGEPTPAELEQIRKREEKKAADDKLKAEKATADAQSNPNATVTS